MVTEIPVEENPYPQAIWDVSHQIHPSLRDLILTEASILNKTPLSEEERRVIEGFGEYLRKYVSEPQNLNGDEAYIKGMQESANARYKHAQENFNKLQIEEGFGNLIVAKAMLHLLSLTPNEEVVAEVADKQDEVERYTLAQRMSYAPSPYKS